MNYQQFISQDIQTLMTVAGFKEGTSLEKARGLIEQGKWKPKTSDSIHATQRLSVYFKNIHPMQHTREEFIPTEIQEQEMNAWLEQEFEAREKETGETAGETEEDEDDEQLTIYAREWGKFVGLSNCPLVGYEQVNVYRTKKEMLEKEIKEKFGVDVTQWGNPLTYTV